MYQTVIKATPRADYKVDVVFKNGVMGVYDCRPLLRDAFWAPLKDRAFFNLAHAECGTLVWNDDIDIAPETVWEDSVKEVASCAPALASCVGGLRPSSNNDFLGNV